ncbi:MAG: MBL fold metallo-hydrolase, partial [Verrucomicrobiota bacterium]|nr:MBL fold metallo-hydrolase [Verrucomicrobiota bacterium]
MPPDCRFSYQNKIIFAAERFFPIIFGMVTANPPLEDELGDVLEKALHRCGLTVGALSERAQVDAARIRDAIDYRSDLNCDELRRLAAALDLNEVGLCALGAGRYPLPEIGELPFCLHALHMTHGIGVANAYLVAEKAAGHGVLFDTGTNFAALRKGWPGTIKKIDAIFLTHVEAEHAGGLCEALAAFGAERAFVPMGSSLPCSEPLAEGATRIYGDIEVTAFSTPGHCAAHNCYLVRSYSAALDAPPVLVSGDLIFAGSVGGGYFSPKHLSGHLRRIILAVS